MMDKSDINAVNGHRGSHGLGWGQETVARAII